MQYQLNFHKYVTIIIGKFQSQSLASKLELNLKLNIQHRQDNHSLRSLCICIVFQRNHSPLINISKKIKHKQLHDTDTHTEGKGRDTWEHVSRIFPIVISHLIVCIFVEFSYPFRLIIFIVI